jgi:hypothetical protein
MAVFAEDSALDSASSYLKMIKDSGLNLNLSVGSGSSDSTASTISSIGQGAGSFPVGVILGVGVVIVGLAWMLKKGK